MRRSAAPSQLHKRAQFEPPSPAPKRPCCPTQGDAVEGSAVAAVDSDTRSAKSILSLLQKTHPVKQPPMQPTAMPATQPPNQLRSPMAKPVIQPAGPLILSATVADENKQPEARYFSVVWCKKSQRKHKKWEGDAIMVVQGRSVRLQDTEGKEISRSSGYKMKELSELEDGSTLPVGGKEVQIQGDISASCYASGQCFVGSSTTQEASSPTPRQKPRPFRRPSLAPPLPRVRPRTLNHMHGPGSLVLPRPPAHHQWHNNPGSGVVAEVVVEAGVARWLRPHQREGVIFLYQCVMGYQQPGQCGAILADQMGLGKTLQCIALLYTLLKQGPYGRPVVQRALVVTPASLTANWGKEFIKWLGRERLSIYTADTSTMVEEYSRRLCPVLVVSYEVAMRCCELLKSMAFDIIICDEAHRLKNCSLKTFSQLASLPCPRRLLLTGTPIQNNLQELFSLVEFVNPGVLGSSTSFRHVYEDPIVASQQPQATVVQQTLGESRAAELNRVTSAFVLRRTQDIIDRWLPTRVEHVVFCHLSPTQRSLYIAVLACRSLNRCVRSAEPGDHLAAIQVLRKLCNHPALLCAHNLPQDSPSQLASEVLSLLPPHLQPGHYSEEDSGKLGVVSRVLAELWQGNRERMVLVSNFTRTLDLLAALCDRHHYPFMRLDGSTPTAKRQQLVDSFNSPNSTHFVFLLSARAGGVGLNLTGASRILLYDVDWNPATDLQAQARVWRDGQTKPVHVYRLVATGSVEEKIFQRQVRKQGLSGAVVESSSSSSSTPATFSTQELQDLFRLHEDTACLTHDLMQCGCNLHGSSTSSRTPQLPAGPLQRDCQLGQEATEASTATLDQLHHWTHLAPPFPHTLLKDECLEAASEFISCVFSHQSSTNTALPSPT